METGITGSVMTRAAASVKHTRVLNPHEAPAIPLETQPEVNILAVEPIAFVEPPHSPKSALREQKKSPRKPEDVRGRGSPGQAMTQDLPGRDHPAQRCRALAARIDEKRSERTRPFGAHSGGQKGREGIAPGERNVGIHDRKPRGRAVSESPIVVHGKPLGGFVHENDELEGIRRPSGRGVRGSARGEIAGDDNPRHMRRGERSEGIEDSARLVTGAVHDHRDRNPMVLPTVRTA